MLKTADGLTFAGRTPGQACAVIGNGPSLRDIDLTRLGAFPSFGMNAAYRHWERIGWYPTYYVCLDHVVGKSHKHDILDMIGNRQRLGIRLFVLRGSLIEWLEDHDDLAAVVDFDELRTTSSLLSTDPVTTGSHSAAFAALLGYERIYLMGIDCNYVEKVAGSNALGGTVLEIAEDGANPNYFFDDYQRKGDRYNVPNPKPGLHVRAWEKMSRAAAASGARFLNTNIASKVTFFESVAPDAFFAREIAGGHLS